MPYFRSEHRKTSTYGCGFPAHNAVEGSRRRQEAGIQEERQTLPRYLVSYGNLGWSTPSSLGLPWRGPGSPDFLPSARQLHASFRSA
jgi:hypothetical protein